jgi:hypothetical protein
LAPRGLGVIRLWICSDDGAFCTVYNESNEKESFDFWYDDVVSAVDAAASVLE